MRPGRTAKIARKQRAKDRAVEDLARHEAAAWFERDSPEHRHLQATVTMHSKPYVGADGEVRPLR